MKAGVSSEVMEPVYQTACYHIPQDTSLHNHYHENSCYHTAKTLTTIRKKDLNFLMPIINHTINIIPVYNALI